VVTVKKKKAADGESRRGQRISPNVVDIYFLLIRSNPFKCMDYRCDDAKKICISELGATPWYQCVADDSRISKMKAIAL
jgi:hypothetical protein